MATVQYTNPMDSLKKITKTIGLTLLTILGIIILFNIFRFFTVIEPGERGLLLQFGNIQKILEPGLHFQMPIINSVVVIDVRIQKGEVSVAAASKDLQSIETSVALNYHVDASKVDELYRNIGTEFYEKIITPAIQESVKATTAQYTAEELITKRQLVKEDIKKDLSTRLASSNVLIDDFSIVNFNFSEEFNSAIESKQTAVQEALKAENDLRRIQIEAQQQIETAKAQAESIRIQGEALKDNNGLVQLKMVEKWNGVLPYYMLGNSVPLLNIPGLQ